MNNRFLPAEGVRYEGGKWVAWTRDRHRIIGIGASREAVRDAAHRMGENDVVYEWVDPANERFLGPR